MYPCIVGVVVVASGSKVAGFGARTGEKKWTHSMDADRYNLQWHISTKDFSFPC